MNRMSVYRSQGMRFEKKVQWEELLEKFEVKEDQVRN